MKLRPLAAGFFSKVVAIIVTYPLQTIRTRVQQKQFLGTGNQKPNKQGAKGSKGAPKYKNSWEVITKVLKHEGPKGFYKGMFTSLIQQASSNSIYFFFYEMLKQMLNVHNEFH